MHDKRATQKHACTARAANARVGDVGGVSDPLAANEIKQWAAAWLAESAIDKVCSELPKVLFFSDGVTADGDFGGNDECDEGAVANVTCDV